MFIFIVTSDIFLDFIKKIQKKKVNELIKLFTKRGITLLIPSFSYTTSGKFYINKTRSKVGFLANYILQNDNIKSLRSEHPLFSFVSIGKHSNIVKKLESQPLVKILCMNDFIAKILTFYIFLDL